MFRDYEKIIDGSRQFRKSQTTANLVVSCISFIFISFFLFSITIAESEPFTITEKTIYGFSENVVFVNVTENTDKDQIINISNIFTQHELTERINYSEVLILQEHLVDIYGLFNESQGKYKTFELIFWNETVWVYNETSGLNESSNITYNRTAYYGDGGIEMICDFVLPDKSCLLEINGVIGSELRDDFLPFPGIKEKTVIGGLKIEQKQEGIPLPKSGLVQLRYVVEHPIPFGVMPQIANKYNITVCSTDGSECTTLDPEWWNSSWTKVKAIEIDGTGLEIPANYPIFLNITYDLDMNSTGKDIRYTASDNSTVLDHWFKTIATSAYFETWVEVTTISNATNTTIYMWYGNDAVASTSNGTLTFDGYFDGTNCDDYTEVDPSSHIVCDDTTDYRLEFTGLTRGEEAYVYQSITPITTDWIAEWTLYYSALQDGAHCFSMGLSSEIDDLYSHTGDSIGHDNYWASSGTTFRSYLWEVDGGSSSANSTAVSQSPVGTYYIRMKRIGNFITAETYTDSARTSLLLNTTKDITGVTPASLDNYYLLSSLKATGAAYASGWVDDHILRKYSANDANINYSFGAEQEPAETTKPTYSNDAHNTTIAGNSIKFSIQYDDTTALHPDGQYIFSTNNTGTWANESAVNFTATPNWANVTKTLNSTASLVIGYRWYADDNAGNINNTGIFSLTTTSATFVDIIPSQALIDGITFNGADPGTNDNAANNNTACSTGTCYNISIDPATTVNIDLYNKATGDLTSGGQTIGMQNMTHQGNQTSSTGDNLIAAGSTSVTLSYALIVDCSNIPESDACHIRYWLDIPTGQNPGSYSSTYKYCSVETGAGSGDCT